MGMANRMEKVEKMRFWEAMRELEAGKKVRGVVWPKEAWISNTGEGHSIPSLDMNCLLFCDWEFYEESKYQVYFPL